MSQAREKEIFQPFTHHVLTRLKDIKESIEYAGEQFEDVREHISDYGEDFSASLDAVKLHIENGESIISADDAITPENASKVDYELEMVREVLSDAITSQIEDEDGIVHQDVDYFVSNYVYSIEDKVLELSDKISILYEYKALADSLSNERFSVVTGNDGETYVFANDAETAKKALLRDAVEFMFEFEMDGEDPVSVEKVLKDMHDLKVEANDIYDQEEAARSLEQWKPSWDEMKMFKGTVSIDNNLEKQRTNSVGMSM